MSHEQYQQCIEACQACATECYHCAVACMNEENMEYAVLLKPCIQLDLECAAICNAAATVMSMGGRFTDQLCHVCIDICNVCAEECEKNAELGLEHCRKCAEMCRKCATACEEMVAVGH